MSKATHTGTCQCCGRSQMLPGGVLSKHGYTVDWGFFNGVCRGAGELPFEQSKDLIEKFIAGALKHRAITIGQQTELRNPATSTRAWIHEYKPAGWGRGQKGGYYWKQFEVIATPHSYGEGDNKHDYFSFHYVQDGGKSHRIDTYDSAASKSLLACCTYLNGRYADALQKGIDQLDDYVAWQRKRIEGWTPQPLKAIKKETSES